MAHLRLAAAFLVLAVSSPALAEETPRRFDLAPKAELPVSLRVPASVLAQVGADQDQGPPRKKPKRNRPDCNQNGCGYKALLGGIAIAKDIQATEQVSVRVIPTTNSLGGEQASTPIVVRARVDGQYGLHLRAKF
ncbi:MAG: hypothetical protein AMXMBFR56_79130 [Polyangiaceae bacterium]